MAYEMVMPYHLHMPSYFLETFTEYPYPENDRIAKVRSVLSLPDHIIPFNLIPVGYPQHREEAKDKFKTENIHYNKW